MPILSKIKNAFTPKKFTSAVILAAGSGERFAKDSASPVKKQFVDILGKTVIERCAEAFDACPLVNEIIVVTGEDEIPYTSELLQNITKLKSVVKGGTTRQESARAGLEAAYDKTDFISIHDGARCLITPQIIEEVIREAYHYGAAAAAEKAVDTVKYANDSGMIEKTIDRDHVYLMKTPQVFMANMYRAAVYSAAASKSVATDDCMLVENIGFKVKAVDCGHENIKLTYATDKIIAEAILNSRAENEEL